MSAFEPRGNPLHPLSPEYDDSARERRLEKRQEVLRRFSLSDRLLIAETMGCTVGEAVVKLADTWIEREDDGAIV